MKSIIHKDFKYEIIRIEKCIICASSYQSYEVMSSGSWLTNSWIYLISVDTWIGGSHHCFMRTSVYGVRAHRTYYVNMVIVKKMLDICKEKLIQLSYGEKI